MEFCNRVLGGSLDLQTSSDRIKYARLEADGVRIVGSDGHPDYPAKVGDNLAIALGGTDKDRLTRIFNELAEGGRIQMPLATQPSGADVGWVRDKFGINWTVTIDRA